MILYDHSLLDLTIGIWHPIVIKTEYHHLVLSLPCPEIDHCSLDVEVMVANINQL